MKGRVDPEAIRRHIRWMSFDPTPAELLDVWMHRVELARISPLPEEVRPLVEKLDELIEQHAQEMIDALNESGCPENFPLDDWTREFYRRHGRELPDGWREQ